MRELHVVGTDPDGALLLSDEPGGRPAFRIGDPEEVRAVLAARTEPAAGRTRGPERRRRPALRRDPTPAQLQARLRAGVSPEALARETGAELDRIRRWAAPVEAEMADVLRNALAARVQGDERTSSDTLGTLVERGTRRLDEDAVDWQVTRRRDGRWRLLLRVRSGARVSTANWLWDSRTARLVPASRRARQLSFGD